MFSAFTISYKFDLEHLGPFLPWRLVGLLISCLMILNHNKENVKEEKKHTPAEMIKMGYIFRQCLSSFVLNDTYL